MIQAARIIGSGLATIGLVGGGIGVVFGGLTFGIGITSQTCFFILVFILPILTCVMLNAFPLGMFRFKNYWLRVKLDFLYLVSSENLILIFLILCRVIFIILYLFFSAEIGYAMGDLEDQILKVKEDITYWTRDYNTLVAIYNESGLANLSEANLSPEQLAERNRQLENLANGRHNVLSSKAELLKLENKNIPSQLSVKRGFSESSEDVYNKKR